MFCSSWGFTYFDVVDRYISVYLMFILGIGQCCAAAWFFRAEDIFAGKHRASAMVLTVTYWLGLLVMGPVTVFAFDKAYLWIGGVIFWVVLLAAVLLSFVIRGANTSCEEWCKEVLFYGAYELAKMVADRSSENLNKENKWWTNLFIGWWGFSIKYFIPWVLWTLMMWNFKADITMDAKTGRGYGGYHYFW